jgi:2-dehydropantoate 2-reductase
MNKKRIVIVGAGAMGTLFAALLSKSRNADVTLVAKNNSAIKSASRGGVTVRGKTRLKIPAGKIKIVSTDTSSAHGKYPPADVAVILVKSFDTGSAARALLPFVDGKTVVITFQNGMGNAEIVKKVLGPLPYAAVLAGATTHGARLKSRHAVEHTGGGETLVAYDSPREKKYAFAASRILSSAGLVVVRARKGSDSLLWSKLIVNAAINPVGAVFSQTNGEILKNDFALKIALSSAIEAARVARAMGIKLLYPSPELKVKSVLAATASNRNSMLQDIAAGRPTEIEAINGAVVGAARRAGVKTPYNRVLYNSVKICLFMRNSITSSRPLTGRVKG